MTIDLKLAHVVMEPLRAKIIRSLNNGPKYISQIAGSIDSDRSTVSYHLGVLEENEIVTSRYEILVAPASKGKAARMYSISNKHLSRALQEIEQALPDLKPTKT